MEKDIYENADITYRTPKNEITFNNVRVVNRNEKELAIAWKENGVIKGKRIWKKNVIRLIEKEGNAIE